MKILDIAFKDLVRSSRSLFLIGMALFAPLLVSLLIYFAFGSMSGGEVSMPQVNVGVVNLDSLPAGSPLSAPLGDTVRSIFFDESVKSWITAVDYPDEAAARNAINERQIGAAVVIPAGFTKDTLGGEGKAAILVLQDPTLSIGPTIVRDMVSSLLDGMAGGGVAYSVLTERATSRGKPLAPAELRQIIDAYGGWYASFQRALFHTPEKAALVVKSVGTGGESSQSAQSVIGLVVAGQVIFFSFFTGAYAMTSILEEDEEGTLARLFTTPTRRTTVLAGKYTAVLLTVLLQGVFLMAAGRVLFGIRWGAPGALALTLLGQMLASVGLGVLLVSFVKKSRQAGPVFGGGLTMLGMLSGLFTTNIAMPEAFNAIGNFTPQGWALKAWKLSLAGQGAGELVVPFLVLAAMGAAMFTAGALVFRKRFA